MRRFSADYLERTRRGLWERREALAPLALGSRSRVLDAGCGTGELTRVLREETPADCEVVGLDADADLLAHARERQRDLPALAGDATRLPFPDDTFELVVCQALLINLPDPAAALREFARVSTDLVAAVEPNNAAVSVASSVDREAALESELREAYMEGVDTDVALGEDVRRLFEAAGLDVVAERRHHHEKRVEPPYDQAAVETAAGKATGEGLDRHRAELERALGEAGYADLRDRWRSMGRDVVRQLNEETYERVEVVPFEVTVGRVGEDH